QVWPHQYISDAALEGTIKAVRQAIGDSGRTQQLIETVYGQGYRFRATVEERPNVRSGMAAEGAMAPLRTPSTTPEAVYHGVLSSPAPGASGVQDSTPGSDAGTQDRPLQQNAPRRLGSGSSLPCCVARWPRFQRRPRRSRSGTTARCVPSLRWHGRRC